MAVELVEHLICDECLRRKRSREATQPVLVTIRGRERELDLCDEHFAVLTAMTRPFHKEQTDRPGQSNGNRHSSPTQERLLELIQKHPGLHPREYAPKLSISAGAISAAGRALRDKKLVKIEGNRAASRYYPRAKAV